MGKGRNVLNWGFKEFFVIKIVEDRAADMEELQAMKIFKHLDPVKSDY